MLRPAFVLRLSAFVFALVIAGVSAAWFVSDIRTGPIRESAFRVDEGARINEAALLRLDENRALGRAENSCRHLDAAVTIRKAAVDQLTQFNAPQFRDAALDSLEDVLIRALRCRPTEGRHWLSLAQTRLTMAGPSEAALSAVEIARWTRPGESDVLIDRIVVLTWLHDAGVDAVAMQLSSEIAVALRHLDLRVIEDLYSVAQPPTRFIYHRELPLIPDERRDRIKRLLQVNADLTSTP